MMGNGLKNRTAVVTGAGSGIGFATAAMLLRAGASVVANARRVDGLERLRRETGAGTDRFHPVAGDACSQSVIDECLDASVERFKSEADTVIVNAGRGLKGSVIQADLAEAQAMFETNVWGALRMMQTAGKRFSKSAGSGGEPRTPKDIVIVGSIVGRHISPFSSVYGASKSSVGYLAEALRRELGPLGIRVTLLEPGFVASGFQDVAGYEKDWFSDVVEKTGPVLSPDDVADAIQFAISRPWNVHINDIVLRPTRQVYP